MKISAIIPVYNEQGYLGRTVDRLLNPIDRGAVAEVIVVDGGSTDHGLNEAKAAGARIYQSELKGRSSQMNEGASHATGDLLYFVHADSLPPIGYTDQILSAVRNGANAGCMRMCFDRDHWALRLKCWFTRFAPSRFHYGDQSLFVRSSIFRDIGGYRTDMTVFEDLDIIERIRGSATFKVLHGPITTSARKYDENGMLRMQLAFYALYPMYRLGYSQERLTKTYKRIVRQDKL